MKEEALKMLLDRWHEIEPGYGTVTDWVRLNKIDRFSVESATKALKRKLIPSFDTAMSLGYYMGMPTDQLRLIARHYNEELYSSLMLDQDIPKPEAMLASRILALDGRKRKLMFELLEILEV